MNGSQPVVFVDADDTLWENNRWFTAVIRDWAGFVGELGVDPDDAVTVLHEEEDDHIPVYGYGARPFCHSLRTAFARVVTAPDAAVVRSFETFVADAETRIRDHRIDLLPGVAAGIATLARAARLIVLTKGQPDEQNAKVARSGLAAHFESVRVVPDKDEICYLAAARDAGRAPEDCWMVGNSPASDVNPARRVGLRTVLVPHHAPWHRDMAPLIDSGPETLVVRTFGDVPPLILATVRTA